MRILFIWHAAVVSAYREKFRVLRRLDPSLDLHVIIPDGSFEGGQWIQYEPSNDDDYTIHRPGSFWTHHPNGFFFRVTAQWLRKLDPDIVHIQEEAWTLAAFQLTRVFDGRASIILESAENLMRPIRRPLRWLEHGTMARVNAFVARSETTQTVLRTKGATQPINIVPNGITVSGNAPSRRRQVILKVGYVGRLSEEKGIPTLLAAIDQLQEPVELIVAGDGPLAIMMQNYRPKHPGITMKYVGRVSHDEVQGIMRAIDVMVVPSHTTPLWAEQFGRVLVEAMAVGTVPVGSSSGSIPWVIGEGGLVFPEGNATMLSQHLQCLNEDPNEWAKLSRQAYHRVQTHFAYDVVGKRLLDFYQKMYMDRQQPVKGIYDGGK